MTAVHPTRAELAAELGYWPASTDPESVERHRRQAAAANAAGRAAVADLYE